MGERHAWRRRTFRPVARARDDLAIVTLEAASTLPGAFTSHCSATCEERNVCADRRRLRRWGHSHVRTCRIDVLKVPILTSRKSLRRFVFRSMRWWDRSLGLSLRTDMVVCERTIFLDDVVNDGLVIFATVSTRHQAASVIADPR